MSPDALELTGNAVQRSLPGQRLHPTLLRLSEVRSRSTVRRDRLGSPDESGHQPLLPGVTPRRSAGSRITGLIEALDCIIAESDSPGAALITRPLRFSSSSYFSRCIPLSSIPPHLAR